MQPFSRFFLLQIHLCKIYTFPLQKPAHSSFISVIIRADFQ